MAEDKREKKTTRIRSNKYEKNHQQMVQSFLPNLIHAGFPFYHISSSKSRVLYMMGEKHYCEELTCSKPPRSSVVSIAELVFKTESGCPVSWAASPTRLVFPLALGPTFGFFKHFRISS